jgi:molecular chaperone GrpE
MDDNNTNQEKDLPQVPTPSELEAKLAETEKQRDEYLAGWQRAKADFINYKKEEIDRLQQVAKYGTEEFIRELIVFLDNFELAIAALEKAGPVEKGIYLIRTQVEDILKRRGVERISVKAGDAFDTSFMESVAEIEGTAPPGAVADEIEAGYRVHEKVIRPVRVRLVKEKS